MVNSRIRVEEIVHVKARCLALSGCWSSSLRPLPAQEQLNADINARIRQEASEPFADHADAART